ncbi:MAG: thioredoxin family protein [Firmicutes bacterium]|jgi:thioredoxin-like negative regulator of GroEL|nr:thioredoxin family protein [Bacillota bacterium]
MHLIESQEELKSLLSDNTMALLYFGSDSCGVCQALKPKVKQLLLDYPKVVSGRIDTAKSAHLAADFTVFTIPVVLVFVAGNEVIREARHVSIRELTAKIQKYYDLVF